MQSKETHTQSQIHIQPEMLLTSAILDKLSEYSKCQSKVKKNLKRWIVLEKNLLCKFKHLNC